MLIEFELGFVSENELFETVELLAVFEFVVVELLMVAARPAMPERLFVVKVVAVVRPGSALESDLLKMFISSKVGASDFVVVEF